MYSPFPKVIHQPRLILQQPRDVHLQPLRGVLLQPPRGALLQPPNDVLLQQPRGVLSQPLRGVLLQPPIKLVVPPLLGQSTQLRATGPSAITIIGESGETIIGRTGEIIPSTSHKPKRLIGGLGKMKDLVRDVDSRIELDDLVYFYPAVDDPDIQGKIGRKLEFSELSSVGQEPIPGRNEFFKHQTFVHRFLREYDDVILIHPPGSGKTCSAGGSSEEFRRSFIAGMVDHTKQYLVGNKGQIKRVYFLVPGVVIKSEVEKQIICSCSREGDYDISYLDEGGPSALTRRINILLRRFYTIETYSQFAKRIREENLTDQGIIDKYSGSMFIIDEAHNLVPSKKGDFSNIIEKSSRNILRGGDNQKKGTGIRKTMIYNMIAKVFRLAKRSKRILMTATPMINSPDEIIDLINLIIPYGQETKYPKMKQDVNYEEHSVEDLRPFFSGRVSFVPDLDTKVDGVYKGQVIQHQELIGGRRYNFKTMVEVSNMLSAESYVNQQLDIERRAIGRLDYTIGAWIERGGQGTQNAYFNISEWVNSNNQLIQLWQDDAYRMISDVNVKFKSDRRQAANFTFPDGSFGEAGFRKFIQPRISSVGDNVPARSSDVFNPTPALKYWLSKELLKFRSSKYARGISLIYSISIGKVIPLDKITEADWAKSPGGKVFCFSEQLRGSGIIIYGLALEENGFERFNESSSVFSGASKTGQSFCISKKLDEPNQGSRAINIRPGRRYAMLTGFTSKTKRETLLELFNSRENRYGDYIQVLLTSPVAQFGLNINDVVQIQLMEGGWHEAGHYQALSRSLRATSHVYLLNDAKEEAINSGKDPSAVRIEVEIYQHAAVDTTGESVDLELYIASEGKAIKIEKLFNKMKALSIDCHVHRFRQERKGSTGKLLHDPTTYQCLPTPNLEKDYSRRNLLTDPSSYNVLYSEDDTKRAINFIYEMFKTKSRYTFEELNDIYKKKQKKAAAIDGIPNYDQYFYDQRFILLAAEKIISINKGIVDQFGFIRYLQEDGESLFLVEKYPLSRNSLGSAHYVQKLMGTRGITLNEVLNTIQKPQQNKMIEAIKLMPANTEADTPNILRRIDELNNTSQVELLEWAIIEEMRRTGNQIAKLVKYKFSYYIFIWGDPVGLVELVEHKYNTIQVGPGRPREEGNLPPIKFSAEDLENPSYYPVPNIYGQLIKNENGGIIAEVSIVFHNLTGLGQGNNDYAISSQRMTGNRPIRLLGLQGKWRDLGVNEVEVYKHLAAHIIKTVKLKRLRKTKLYGTLEGEKFRIIALSDKEDSFTDKRKVHRGKVCTSFTIPELISFLYSYGKAAPVIYNLKPQTKGDIINEMLGLHIKAPKNFKNRTRLAEMDDSELLFYYNWYVYIGRQAKKKKKEILCGFLQAAFDEKNQLI